jgi:uncharacterized protein YdaU (DUF1376 family)
MRSHSVRTADEIDALKNVLSDFFELVADGYIHKRCEDTILKYHGKSDKARASAMARWGDKKKGKNAEPLVRSRRFLVPFECRFVSQEVSYFWV